MCIQVESTKEIGNGIVGDRPTVNLSRNSIYLLS